MNTYLSTILKARSGRKILSFKRKNNPSEQYAKNTRKRKLEGLVSEIPLDMAMNRQKDENVYKTIQVKNRHNAGATH